MCGSMIDIQFLTVEIIGEEKQKEEKKKPPGKYNGLPYFIGRP